MAIRFFIEQAPDRFYRPTELAAAKRRAARLSARSDNGVYVIAEEFDRELGDYLRIGSIAYYGGYQDAVEGRLTAELASA